MKDLLLPDTPLVSVVIATYNRATLIGESIRSVIDQTYTNWEMIIIDDGSSDNTREVVQQYHDKRISYYRIEHNGFLGKVRNIGLRKATGDLVAFQDSDDIWRPHKLEYQITLLKEHRGTAFVLSNNDQFGPNAVQTPDYEPLFVGSLFLPMLSDGKFCFCGTTLIFHRAVFDEIGFLEESIPMMREIHFFFRMSSRFNGIFTNERLVNARKHAHSTSNNYAANAQVHTLKMLQEFYEAGALTRQDFTYLSSVCYYKMGLFFLKKNDPSIAVKNFWKHNTLRPLQFKGWARLGQAFIKKILPDKAAAS